jgi:anti-sigma-K factor RskA
MKRDPETRDLLAAEYVLGTLRGAARARFERELRADPALRRAVVAWESRLEGFDEATAPVAPPAPVWDRVAAVIAPVAAPAAPSRAGLWQSAVFWRWVSAGLAAAALVLAVITLQPRAPTGTVVAVLQDQAKEPVWTLRLDSAGRRLVAETLRPQSPGPDRALQLWVLPPGATAPAPGPLLPLQGRGETALPPALVDLLRGQGQVLVSVEPPGGAPAGVPTGPVLYSGALRGI